MTVQQQPSSSGGVWLGGALIGGIVLVAIISSSGNTPPAQPTLSNIDTNESTGPAVAGAPKVALPAVASNSVVRAARHLKLALDAEGFSGAMIYSQNCFASLTTKFSWGKLDQCEAFDSLAEAAMSQSTEDGPEATYFAKDATESRFTTVAFQHQGEIDSVQSHLSDLTREAFAQIADLETEDAPSQLSDAAAGGPVDNSAASDQLNIGSSAADAAAGAATNN
jgi:hypothetical protein